MVMEDKRLYFLMGSIFPDSDGTPSQKLLG